MLVFPYFKLTHCDRQRCIRPCGRNHRVAPASRIHGQRHRRGSRAETCGLRCGGQIRSTRSHIWGEPAIISKVRSSRLK